jgi:hypothetical protein
MLLNVDVWSSGTETWSPAIVDVDEFIEMSDGHVKTVSEKLYYIARDDLGRWFRLEFALKPT